MSSRYEVKRFLKEQAEQRLIHYSVSSALVGNLARFIGDCDGMIVRKDAEDFLFEQLRFGLLENYPSRILIQNTARFVNECVDRREGLSYDCANDTEIELLEPTPHRYKPKLLLAKMKQGVANLLDERVRQRLLSSGRQ